MIKDLKPELRISSDSVMITGDFHIPFQNNDIIDDMLKISKDNNIDTLICAGDYLDCFNFSTFIKKDYLESTFQDEMNEAASVMKKLLKTFDNIYFTEGNHERLWLKQLEGISGIKDLFKIFTSGFATEGDDYIITEYDHLILNDDWYICHPHSYSRVPLSISKKLASKFHMNIVCAHMHRLAISKDDSAKYYVIESGGLFDINKLSYLKDSTSYPSQFNGLLYIKDNVPYLRFY